MLYSYPPRRVAASCGAYFLPLLRAGPAGAAGGHAEQRRWRAERRQARPGGGGDGAPHGPSALSPRRSAPASRGLCSHASSQRALGARSSSPREQALRERFPEMFSDSQRCKAPHLNIDSLKDKLFQARAGAEGKFGSGGNTHVAAAVHASGGAFWLTARRAAPPRRLTCFSRTTSARARSSSTGAGGGLFVRSSNSLAGRRR